MSVDSSKNVSLTVEGTIPKAQNSLGVNVTLSRILQIKQVKGHFDI